MKAPRIEADIQHVVKKEKRSSNTCVHIYIYVHHVYKYTFTMHIYGTCIHVCNVCMYSIYICGHMTYIYNTV
jgi:hypothetical protein